MVSDLNGLLSVLEEATPEKYFEKRVENERAKIESALKTVGTYEFEDDEGHIFLIRAHDNGKG